MVALIFCGDLKYCPYIQRYIERLEANDVEYKVFFWNRSGFDLDLPSYYEYYGDSSELSKGKISKLFDFIKFRSWVMKKINNVNPDKIIALSTLTGVVLGRELYHNRRPYVFDIRDYSYEHILPFYWIEKQVIKNSDFTAISSRGFESFLPKHEYIIAHNFNRNDIKTEKKFVKKTGKLSFVWNGVVRYFEFQKQYLDALKNDDRFEIIFHGDGPELTLYKDYCKLNNIENVIFTGAYDNSEKEKLLENADILNNCYGYAKNAGNKLKYAVSNRFYDGMIYHIPQLVESNGYKTEWARKTGLGVNFAADNEFADTLYEYYMKIETEQFDRACERVLHQVLTEDDWYINQIDNFISK